MAEYVRLLESQNVTLDMLAQEYGGYRFTFPAEEVINPWALLNRFEQAARGEPVQDLWGAETPKWTNKMLRQDNIPEVLSALASKKRLADSYGISVDSFDQLTVSDTVALLQQTGYLTIRDMKDRDREAAVLLAVPNTAVMKAFWRPNVLGNSINDTNVAGLFDDMLGNLSDGDLPNFNSGLERLSKLGPWAVKTLVLCFWQCERTAIMI